MSRKRGRDAEEESSEFMPLSKRINNLHINGLSGIHENVTENMDTDCCNRNFMPSPNYSELSQGSPLYDGCSSSQSSYIAEYKPDLDAVENPFYYEKHPPQDTKIVAGPSSWLTAWLELALVGWLEVRTVVERLVGLEIAWWWVPTEVSEAPPWHLAASNPSRWGCKQQPCLAPTPYPCGGTVMVEWGAILGHFDDYPPCSRIPLSWGRG
ncbi:unnamed protein product, partial [Heterotrigona itama]